MSCTCHHPNPGFACVADVHRSAPADIAAAREDGRREAIADAAVETTRLLLEASAKAGAEGYDACTADVVKMCESIVYSHGVNVSLFFKDVAERIKRGEHIGAAGKGKL